MYTHPAPFKIMDKKLLPELTKKESDFVEYYWFKGLTGTDAYRQAYNSNGSTATCCVEASRLLKNPKISLWIDFFKTTKEQYIQKEIQYSVDDAFRECDELKVIALESTGKDGKPNVAGAIKAVEMKVKLKGLINDEQDLSNKVVVNMGSVTVDGKELELNVGENPTGDNKDD